MLNFYHVINWLKNESLTKSVIYPVFELVTGSYELKLMFINDDGHLTIEGEDFSFDDLEEGVRNGAIVTTPPRGFEVYVPHLVSLRCESVMDIVPIDAFLMEVQDLQKWLSNRPTSLDECRGAYANASSNPNTSNIDKLRTAYLSVPMHLRCYLLSFDEKDFPIRKIIGIP